MASTVIGLAILIWVLVLFIKRPSAGAIAALMAMLFAPYVPITSSVSFRIEHLLSPLMFGILCIRSYVFRRPLALPKIAMVYAAWFSIGLVATFAGVITSSDISIEWLGMYGVLRPLLTIIIFANVLPDANAATRKMALLFAYSAVPLGMLAVGQTADLPFCRELTDMFYSSPGRPVLSNQMSGITEGYLFRALSVFENVSFAGTYFLLVLFIGFLLLGEPGFLRPGRERQGVQAAVLMALLGGISTLSSTFVGGAIVLLVVLFFGLDRRWKVRIAGLITAAAALFYAVLMLMPSESRFLDVALYSFTKATTSSGLAQRYDSSGSQTSDAVAVTNDRPLIGWGYATKADVIVNDSAYVFLYYSSGALGIALFGVMLLAIGLDGSGTGINRKIMWMWIAIFILAGISCITIMLPRISEWWWAFVGVAYRTYPAAESAIVSRWRRPGPVSS